MKNLIVLIVIFITSTTVWGQIGGISGSKLNSVCVDVVDYHKMEFEPGFYFFSTNTFWDNNSRLSNLFASKDSISNSSGMLVRFTYGLFDRLEIGVNVPVDMCSGSWGIRYVISQSEKFGVAAIAGLDTPFGNSTHDKRIHTEENTIQAGLGSVVSYQYDENFSIDVNAQYGRFVRKLKNSKGGSVYLSIDAGYYFFARQLQAIAGFGYQRHNDDSVSQFIVTFYPGITIETGKNYIIVLSSPFDIYGRNAAKTFSLSFALTVTID